MGRTGQASKGSTSASRAGAKAEAAPAPPFGRLLLTGAAGGLGRQLRPRLKRLCRVLRVSDVADLGAAPDGEEVVRAALEEAEPVLRLLEGVEAVVHLGGVYNLYEAARRQRTRRIVFASSNHVTGFYRQDEVIDPTDPPRPDGYYGVSKAFGESLARFYFDRYGIETVCLRIGSSFPEPVDRRMLATWLSYDDLERLVVASLTAPVAGFSIVYGVSANRTSWWDNAKAAHLGYRPQDSSEPWRSALEAKQPVLDPKDPVVRFQGGGFVVKGPYE
jgi:uronate dehydrogenase